jgi:hypothetical protein
VLDGTVKYAFPVGCAPGRYENRLHKVATSEHLKDQAISRERGSVEITAVLAESNPSYKGEAEALLWRLAEVVNDKLEVSDGSQLKPPYHLSFSLSFGSDAANDLVTIQSSSDPSGKGVTLRSSAASKRQQRAFWVLYGLVCERKAGGQGRLTINGIIELLNGKVDGSTSKRDKSKRINDAVAYLAEKDVVVDRLIVTKRGDARELASDVTDAGLSFIDVDKSGRRERTAKNRGTVEEAAVYRQEGRSDATMPRSTGRTEGQQKKLSIDHNKDDD